MNRKIHTLWPNQVLINNINNKEILENFTNNIFDSLVEIILKFLKEDKNKILNKVIIAKKRSNDYTFFEFFLSFRNNFIDNS